MSNRSIAYTRLIPAVVNYSHINMSNNDLAFVNNNLIIFILTIFLWMREVSFKSIFNI